MKKFCEYRFCLNKGKRCTVCCHNYDSELETEITQKLIRGRVKGGEFKHG